MSTTAVWQAVYGLYLADTGEGGLKHASAPIISAMYNTRADESVALASQAPFVVFGVRSDTSDDTLGNEASRVRVVFAVYSRRALGMDVVAPVLRRLKTVYHRVQPAAITGYKFSKLRRVSGQFVPTEDEMYCHVEEYELMVFDA